METRWLVGFLLYVAILMTASELGFRIARRLDPERAVHRKDTVGVVAGGVLALLGLLLAFGFSAVESRFESRKAIVIEDANAIGTAYLRAELLPSPHDDRVQQLLRMYISMRLALPTERDRLAEALRQVNAVQRELWNEADAIEQLEPRDHSTHLFVEALNHVIDIHQQRVTVALQQRLPHPVIFVLYIVSVLSLGIVGINEGLTRSRATLVVATFVVAVATVLTLIVELDRPVGSVVKISQQALTDTADMMSSPTLREARAPDSAAPR